MSKKEGNQPVQEQHHCKAEACKAKPWKFGFCKEHYELYMAGVIRGDGTKPVDYEQKLAQFQKARQNKAA